MQALQAEPDPAKRQQALRELLARSEREEREAGLHAGWGRRPRVQHPVFGTSVPVGSNPSILLTQALSGQGPQQAPWVIHMESSRSFSKK